MEPVPETRWALEQLSGVGGEDVLTGFRSAIDSVVSLIPDCVGLSISLRENGLTFTFVRSDDIAGVIDAVQYLDDGPCEETIRTGAEILLDEVLDEDRWQLYAQTTAAAGVRSSLSLPLRENDAVTGSVNFYGGDSQTFQGEEAYLARAFGARVEDAINNADLSMSTLANARRAPASLAELAATDQAVGILIARNNVSPEEAARRFSEAAERAGISDVQLAQAIIASIPQPPSLTDFLLARITEDETLAREVLSWRKDDMERRPGKYSRGYDPANDSRSYAADANMGKPVFVSGPARVLAECAAKRRILEIHRASVRAGDEELSTPTRRVTQALAAVYDAHPEWREEWRP